MITPLKQLNSSKIFSSAIVGMSIFVLAFMLSDNITRSVEMAFYENEQWQASQRLEFSAEVVELLNDGDESVADLNRQISEAETIAQQEGLNVIFNQEILDDGSMIVAIQGTGQGYDELNELFFDGNADISVNVVDDQQQITIRQTGINSGDLAELGGTNIIRITGDQILDSNADQIQLNTTAIWENPDDIDITLIEIPGDPPELVDSEAQAAAEPETVNVIINGDFETPWNFFNGVAPNWESYSNGQGHFSWYDEQWPEAVRKLKGHAQLMEIKEVEPNILDRVIAIYQTVGVAANAQYNLKLYAIMRTDAAEADRNNSEYEMHWGIDPWGEGNYNNVETWVPMPLTEQLRIGSTAPYPYDIPLTYERITGTVKTGANTNKITLFIRGVKKFPNGMEVNFDVDDVSLVGPPLGTVLPAAYVSPPQQPDVASASQTTSETPTIAPVEETDILPASGTVLSSASSWGVLAMSVLVLVILGGAATVNIVAKQLQK